MNLMNSIAVLWLIRSVASRDESCTGDNRKLHRFHPLRHCQRSNKTIVALENFNSSSHCADYAREKKGLAFNFSPQNRRQKDIFSVSRASDRRRHILDQPENFFNCLVLDCPEYQNFSHLVNDSRFDYYSLYTNPPPPTNATCIPRVGLFHLHRNPLNYSTAAMQCDGTSHGVLAHIVSEIRTERISRFLAQNTGADTHHRFKAYVGLNYSTTDGCFVNAEKEHVECNLYSAWGPGHPREKLNHTCVAITTEQSWLTVDCRRKLPFICEIYSSGPNCSVNVRRKGSRIRANNKEVYENNEN